MMKRLIKTSFISLSIISSQQSLAWIPCVLICDAACMGLSFDVGTMNALVAFESISVNATTLSTSLSQSTASISALSQSVATSFNTSSTSTNNLINIDAPLTPSLTSREVKSLDGITINLKSAIDEHTELLANNTLELSNSITQAFKTHAKLEVKSVDRMNTSNVFDSTVQNTYEISNHFKTKNENLSLMLNQAFIGKKLLDSNVKGQSSIRNSYHIDQNQIFEDITFNLSPPLEKESWRFASQISSSPANLTLLSTDYKDITKTKEFRLLDSKRIFSGSEIDLQALNLSKSQRRNLFLFEYMQGANFSPGAIK